MRSNLSANITKNLKLDVNLSGLMDERNTPHYGAYDIIRQRHAICKPSLYTFINGIARRINIDVYKRQML